MDMATIVGKRQMTSVSSANHEAPSERGIRPRMRLSTGKHLKALSHDRMRQFLARRLQFSALALAITLTAVLLLKAATGLWGSVWFVLAATLVTCVWGLTVRMNQLKLADSKHGLRQTEVAVFAYSFGALACLTFANLEAASLVRESYGYLLSIRESLLISIVLVMIYGVAIPNQIGRSLLVTSVLSLIPIATVTASLLSHDSVFAESTVALSLLFAVKSMLPLAGAVCCAALVSSANERVLDRSINIEELGSYLLKQPLGSGGMGDVYLAEHRLLKRLCAVKLIHPDKAGDSKVKARFEQEVKATAGLTHPNTVHVYDYGTTHGGRFFYAMEFLEGLNLDQYVQKFGSMPPGRVIYILKQICGALHEAWCEGLVHRDIKPSNIFLSERGQLFDVAKLLDFGLAQPTLETEAGTRRVQTQIQGSPAFMCPEQATGIKPDCRGDMYSLGAVAWFLLTGHPPFREENPVMLIVSHATEPVPNIAETGVAVPDDLATIIVKCLAKKPEDRFDSPRNLLLALDKCSDSDEWTWEHAEDWWLTHVPTHSSKLNEHEQSVAPVASPLDRTLIIDRLALALMFVAGPCMILAMALQNHSPMTPVATIQTEPVSENPLQSSPPDGPSVLYPNTHSITDKEIFETKSLSARMSESY